MVKKAVDAEKPAKKSEAQVSIPSLPTSFPILYVMRIRLRVTLSFFFCLIVKKIIIAKSSTGTAKKGKVSPYNKFMKTELARLKESDPDMKHAER